MRKFGTLFLTFLLPFISIEWTTAQVQSIGMSDLREINLNITRLVDDYEAYSGFSNDEDVAGFRNLFTSPGVLVYCDVAEDDKYDDQVDIDDYIGIVRRNYLPEYSTTTYLLKINLPDLLEQSGSSDVELVKSSNGSTRCNSIFTYALHLIVKISFQIKNGSYTNFGISGIRVKESQGKPIILHAVNYHGKELAFASLYLNNCKYKTDKNGNISYLYVSRNKPLIIKTRDLFTSRSFRFANYKDIYTHCRPRSLSCEPKIVELKLWKTAYPFKKIL
jgi:hypothetical protein